MTFTFPDDLRAAIHRGDPLLSIARSHGVPLHRLPLYPRRPRRLPPIPPAQAIRNDPRLRPRTHAIPRRSRDLRALERLLLHTQHHIDRWHDPIARQQRAQKESRREAIRKETYIDDNKLFEYQVERRAVGYFLNANEHLRPELIRWMQEARESFAAA